MLSRHKLWVQPPARGKWRQKDQEFKTVFINLGSWRSARDMSPCLKTD